LKQRLFVSATLAAMALFGCFRHDDSYSALWGVWNLGPQKAAIFNYHSDGQLYARTPDFLSFEKGTRGKPRIVFDGGYYDIKSITGQYPQFDINLERQPDKLVGNRPPANLRGHVRVSLVGEGRMWINVLRDSGTDTEFDNRIGTGANGPDSVYWRANKLEKPLAPTE
jgi:hypothetical protein